MQLSPFTSIGVTETVKQASVAVSVTSIEVMLDLYQAFIAYPVDMP